MTNDEKAILIALSIGDGHIEYKETYRFSCGHSEHHKEYVYWKAELLSNILNKKIKVYKTTQNKNTLYRISTTDNYFKFIRRRLYKNRDKLISSKILNRLTLQGLAIWYMDDGSLSQKKKNSKVHANDLVFHTCCDKEQAQLILFWFETKFNIKGTLKKESSGSYSAVKNTFYSIRFGTKSARVLIEVIKPFMFLPLFQYKINVKS